ncbi:MAG: hypothetical protein ACAI43_20780 [Phycisphaerae bacterium]|nr:hypothetical protein [Tepidisphaeraceae bacterium]
MADDEWVELCAVPMDEARRVVARLEAAMLPFTLPAGEGGPAVDDAGRVAVFVLAEDLDVAREILGATVADVDDDADDDPAEAAREAAERAVEHWICPRCGQRALEVSPLSPRARRLRVIAVVLLALPLAAGLLARVWPDAGVLRHAPAPATGLWILVVGGLMLALLPAVDRGRRCRVCGWGTDSEDGLARRE